MNCKTSVFVFKFVPPPRLRPNGLTERVNYFGVITSVAQKRDFMGQIFGPLCAQTQYEKLRPNFAW